MTRTLYITEQGSSLSLAGERLVVEKSGETLADIPASKVVRVFVFGNVSLTTPAIAYLLKAGKDVAFLSNRGRYYGRLISSESKGAALRRAQLRASDDLSTCLELSKRFVMGKLKNQRRLLHRRPGPRTSSVAKEMTTMIKRIQGTGSLEVLRGVEGHTARLYFGAFGGMLEGMEFVGRRRRPPSDHVNSMLSLGCTMLTYEAFSAVSVVGLDPYVGFFHRDSYGRPSLALDIMQEFRPAVVDLIVLGTVNRGHIRHEDLEVAQEAGEPVALLKENARKRFFGLYEHRMLTQINHRSRTMTYREALRTQVRQVVNRINDRRQVYEPVLLS